jgi:hypothetical protein
VAGWGRSGRLGKEGWAGLLDDPLPPHGEFTGDGGSLSWGHIANHVMDVVDWNLDQEWPDSLDRWERSLAAPGFTAAFAVDAGDLFWQSADQVSDYRTLGRPLAGARTYVDEDGCERVDVSGDPGRRAGLPGMWFCPAPVMWFGPPAFEVLDRGRLLDGPGRVEELDHGLVRIGLFDVTDPLDLIRHRQKELREQLDIDRLEALDAREVLEERDDPWSRVQVTQASGAVVVAVTEWLDEDGRRVRRSRAVRSRTVTSQGGTASSSAEGPRPSPET